MSTVELAEVLLSLLERRASTPRQDGVVPDVASEMRERIAAAKMPPEVELHTLREISRLSRTSEVATEYGMLRTYIEWLLDLPWSVRTSDVIDMQGARDLLDQEHHGLRRVKRRILEFLAVRKLNPSGKSPILCFLGPPGVGKTSLGQSIARATGRRFVHQSLGGIHDEAEIHGNRRTYAFALPGRIIQGLRRAGTLNPVFMLDEVDKLATGEHGDPASALLEVLDPEQNHAFEDHYLGVPISLREVMFIATANVLSNVPRALRDRMEVIEIPGYTEEDKMAISRRFLLPRQIRESGLDSDHIELADLALRELIRSYTRESGVRQLDRELAAICRSVATQVAEGNHEPVRVTPEVVGKMLGPVKYFNEVALRTSLPGVATGLAWTPTGGEILFIEVTRMPGEGKLILTGQLGDVMRESALTALSLVKSRAHILDLPSDFFRNHDLHLHIPSGAIPKDGPSAGVTIFVALVSLLAGRHIRHDVAMTGEISLRGLVLPVGGVKEKVLAARRAGVRRVLMPELNRIDLDDDIPKEVLDAVEIHFPQTVDDALELALEPEPEAEEATPRAERGGDSIAKEPRADQRADQTVDQVADQKVDPIDDQMADQIAALAST